MKEHRTEIENEISSFFANFLGEQLGERATSIKTYVSSNTFAVRAANCLSPGEKNLVKKEQDWNLLQKTKAQQFDKVKPLLKKRLEKATGCKILQIHSSIGQDGIRFVFVTLSINIETEPTRTWRR